MHVLYVKSDVQAILAVSLSISILVIQPEPNHIKDILNSKPVSPLLCARFGEFLQGAIALLDELSACPDALGRSDFMEDLILELPLDIALAFQSSKGSRRSPDSRVRDFAVRKAISFIEDHVDEPFPIRVLCDEVGVGWTTLVQGFREHFGMTPKAYVRALRLNGARKQLLSAEPKTRVADIANAWGFWHMGQFAADYRRLFLERPSETMKRVYAS